MKKKLLKAVYAMTKYTLYSFIIQCALTTLLMAAEPANSQRLERVNISLNVENASLEEIFTLIESKTKFRFTYLRKNIPSQKKTSIAVADENLKMLLQPTDQEYCLCG